MTGPPTIQPKGFHFGLSGGWIVDAVSANIGEYLDTSIDDALGRPITTLFSNDTIHDVRNRLALLRGDDGIEHLFHFPLSVDRQAFDLTLYRNGSGFGIDAEPCTERGLGDATGILGGMLSRVAPSDDIGQLCDQAGNQLRALTGFEQVVISADHEQLGRSVRAGATPIDAKNTSADDDLIVFDRDAAAVPIHAIDDDWVARRLTWRSPVASEVARLASIGARAALIVPLDRGGRPWGQAACYHSAPRHVSAERRNIARLFAQIVSLRIELAELRRVA